MRCRTDENDKPRGCFGYGEISNDRLDSRWQGRAVWAWGNTLSQPESVHFPSRIISFHQVLVEFWMDSLGECSSIFASIEFKSSEELCRHSARTGDVILPTPVSRRLFLPPHGSGNRPDQCGQDLALGVGTRGNTTIPGGHGSLVRFILF